jgi:serine/threonine protein kinase
VTDKFGEEEENKAEEEENAISHFFALKKVENRTTQLGMTAKDEISLISSLKHDNLITYKDYYFPNNYLVGCLVMEICEYGSLSKLVEDYKTRGEKIPEEACAEKKKREKKKQRNKEKKKKKKL